MNIEKKLLDYLENKEKLQAIEKEILEILPDNLWDKYCKLKAQLPSDKAVISSAIKKAGDSVSIGNHTIKIGSRNRKKVDGEGVLSTAMKLKHLETLIEYGVVTGVTVSEDQISRLDPELQAIYEGFVSKTPYTVLTWPKKL